MSAFKWLAVLSVIIVSFDYWASASSGPIKRVTALLVFVLFTASIAYLLYVSSQIRLSVPGLDLHTKQSAGEGAGEDGGDAPHGVKGMLAKLRKPKEQEGVTRTVQVSRLSTKGPGAVIANYAFLPILFAKTALTVETEPEGETASDEGQAKLVMGEAFSIPARSSRSVAVSTTFDHVGIYMMRSAGVRIWDLLGLLSCTSGSRGQWRVRVVPNIYRLTRGIPRERKMSQDSLGIPDVPADALDYARVRDYEPGDPLKTIHWKIVAHSQGELYTKLFETSTFFSVTLLVDPFGPEVLSGTAYGARHMYDTMLEGGFSLIEHARQMGMQGSLRFVNRSGSLIESGWKGIATLGWFVETARRPSYKQSAVSQSIAAIRSLRDGDAGYVIFATSELSDKSVRELIACHHSGVPLLVVHALPSQQAMLNRQHALDARLRKASIDVIELTDGPQIVREVASS